MPNDFELFEKILDKIEDVRVETKGIQKSTEYLAEEVTKNEEAIANIAEILRGNGKHTSGLIGRVSRLEVWKDSLTWLGKLITAAIIVEVVATLFLLLKSIL